MAELIASVGPRAGKRYSLDQPHTRLGRHPSCDIVVDAGAVSRYHTQIIKENGRYFVEDMGSRNGTYLNEYRLSQRQELRDADQIRVCDFVFVYHGEQADSDSESSLATKGTSVVLIEDDEQGTKSSIMTRLDVSSVDQHVHISATAEVKLEAFLKLSTSLGQAMTTEDVLPPVLDALFKIFLQAERGLIVLYDQQQQLRPARTKFRRPQNDSIRISRTILNHVVENRTAILSADAADDSRFELSESIANFQIRSLMCAPLIDNEGHVLGAVQLEATDSHTRFRDPDLEVLVGVASQAATAIHAAKLHEEALEQRALQRELELAHKVQLGLLPRSRPQLDGFDFYDYYHAANKIGGDYYDYIPLPDGELATIVADVSGHGIAAALLMATLSAEARSCLARENQAGAVMSHLNDVLCDDRVDDRFVTMVLMVLQPRTNEVTIVNAGHCPPIWRRVTGELVPLDRTASGLPLGVSEGFRYQHSRHVLEPGTALITFTDGITEAMNAVDEQFGPERLHRELSAKHASLQALGERVVQEVKNFAGDTPQSDDICLVCLGRR